MQRYIAFLRGINLGKRRMQMSRLKSLFAELGFNEVATFIASGNVLFSTGAADVGRLEARIAAHLETSLGYRVDTFIRTADQVAAIAGSRPFPEDGREGITVHVGFWHRKVPADLARKLAAVRTAEDEFRVEAREFYWLCRVRTSDSKVWTLPAIKALKFPTTTLRNMTSIRKLAAKHLV
jgi:uncharacterized protein (DUF1697 family)